MYREYPIRVSLPIAHCHDLLQEGTETVEAMVTLANKRQIQQVWRRIEDDRANRILRWQLAKASVTVSLAPEDAGTLVTYRVEAPIPARDPFRYTDTMFLALFGNFEAKLRSTQPDVIVERLPEPDNPTARSGPAAASLSLFDLFLPRQAVKAIAAIALIALVVYALISPEYFAREWWTYVFGVVMLLGALLRK